MKQKKNKECRGCCVLSPVTGSVNWKEKLSSFFIAILFRMCSLLSRSFRPSQASLAPWFSLAWPEMNIKATWNARVLPSRSRLAISRAQVIPFFIFFLMSSSGVVWILRGVVVLVFSVFIPATQRAEREKIIFSFSSKSFCNHSSVRESMEEGNNFCCVFFFSIFSFLDFVHMTRERCLYIHQRVYTQSTREMMMSFRCLACSWTNRKKKKKS